MSERAATVVVLEPNQRVGVRIARVVSSVAALDDVAYVERAEALPDFVGARTRLLACGGPLVSQVVKTWLPRCPDLKIMAWNADAADDLIALAESEPRFSNVLGWPEFHSAPRPWEVAMVARRLIHPATPPPRIGDLMAWGASALEWRPQTNLDMESAASAVMDASRRWGVQDRAVERLGEIAHELLMNAMYGAPVDAQGMPRYAHFRSDGLVLHAREVPTLRLASDGMRLAIEVEDPFGTLRRTHVFPGISRGLRAGKQAGSTDAVIDATGGGAGLGMFKLYQGSAALVIDVVPGHATTVTSIHDIDRTARERRGMPPSLHFFEL